MSGWWFAALAASATRFTKAIAPLNPLNVKVFVRAVPSLVQPEPEASNEASAAPSSRVSFSGTDTGGAQPVRVSHAASEPRYPDPPKTFGNHPGWWSAPFHRSLTRNLGPAHRHHR